ncbi:hypothetical protein J6590_029563 [Homalodisca vitripennis]|nr:hypothetical protein J6590_029563 [Homalodisca vitripennis]
MFDNLPPADKVMMNPAKVADVRSLFRFLTPADVRWYESLFEGSHECEVAVTRENASMSVHLTIALNDTSTRTRDGERLTIFNAQFVLLVTMTWASSSTRINN